MAVPSTSLALDTDSGVDSRVDANALLTNKDNSVAVDGNELWEKALNGLFLAGCFGAALHAVVNVDHGMTRGWTQSEIAMRIPMDTWSSYESALSSKPIFTKTAINVVIYLLGDWLSQTLFAGNDSLDFSIERTLKNGFIGLCFGPLVHQYYEWSDWVLPVEGGLYNRLGKVMMDQTLYLSIKCSIYIAAVGLLSGETWEEVQDKVKTRIGPVCVTAWKFWPLVHCITYGVIPARHRVLWVNSVDLIWNAILATLSRSDKESPDANEETDTVAAVGTLEPLAEVETIALSNALALGALQETPDVANYQGDRKDETEASMEKVVSIDTTGFMPLIPATSTDSVPLVEASVFRNRTNTDLLDVVR